MTMIQYLALAGSLFFMAVVIVAVVMQKLKEAYAMIWLGTALLMVLLSIRLDILHWFSEKIGIYYPPATLFLILLFGILCILLQYSIVLSKNNDRIRRLTQELALLREELDFQKNKSKDS